MNNGRLPRSAREVVAFVLIVALLVGFVVMGLDHAAGGLVEGRGKLLDTWDVFLAAGTALGLLAVAAFLRSWGIGVLAIAFSGIALSQQFPWLEDVGRSLARRVDLTGLQPLVPASEQTWAEFLVATGLAVAVVTIAFLVPDSSTLFRRARQILLPLVLLLFAFAAGLELLNAAGDCLWLGWMEEMGERLILSAAGGYVAGFVLTVVKTPSFGHLRSGHRPG